jgi:hypothetical protein
MPRTIGSAAWSILLLVFGGEEVFIGPSVRHLKHDEATLQIGVLLAKRHREVTIWMHARDCASLRAPCAKNQGCISRFSISNMLLAGKSMVPARCPGICMDQSLTLPVTEAWSRVCASAKTGAMCASMFLHTYPSHGHQTLLFSSSFQPFYFSWYLIN